MPRWRARWRSIRSLLFLDEPTAGLDPIAAAAFDDLVLYLRRTLGLTVVMVTHDLDTLARTCDRVAVLVDRKVIVDTLAGIVRNDHPWIREYFHGARGRVIGGGRGATAVERDAKYATVALFALACVVAARGVRLVVLRAVATAATTTRTRSISRAASAACPRAAPCVTWASTSAA